MNCCSFINLGLKSASEAKHQLNTWAHAYSGWDYFELILLPLKIVLVQSVADNKYVTFFILLNGTKNN